MRRPSPAEQLVRAYAALIPVLPLLRRMAEAERAAPGYGADAIVFRAVCNEIEEARRV